MGLNRRQLQQLVDFVATTRDDEISCDECLTGMAEFAEAELVGAEVAVALKRIEVHLESCPECADEYAVLIGALRAGPVESSS